MVLEKQKELTIADLQGETREGLMEIAKEQGISGYSQMKKQEIIVKILQTQTEKDGNIFAEGIL